MQLFQERKFGNLISDTFTFFKEFGKNYFKNYLALNGVLMLLFVVVFIFGYREFFLQMINSNVNGNSYFFQSYFQENNLLLILGFVVFIILFLLMSIIMYTFPVLYMKRIAETGDRNIKPDQMLGDIKKNVYLFLSRNAFYYDACDVYFDGHFIISNGGCHWFFSIDFVDASFH